MRVTQRQVVFGILGLLIVGFGLFLISLFITGGDPSSYWIVTGNLLGYSGLLAAYYFGFDWARFLAVLLIACTVGLAMPEVFVTQYAPLLLALVPVVAMLLASSVWVIGSTILMVLILLYRAGGQGIYTDPVALITLFMVVGGLVLSRLVTDTAQRAAEDNATRIEEALIRSEAQSRELAQQAAELAEQNDQQRRLLDLVATLETPAVALANGVLLAPVVGHLDSRRAQNLTTRLLNSVSTQRTHLVILDIAGVSTVDTEVAHALLRAVQALRLLGCQVTITGISAPVAATMTTLGINMSGVTTARTPQEALEQIAGNGALLHANGVA